MHYVDELRASARSLMHWSDLPFFSGERSCFEQVCEQLQEQIGVLPRAGSTFEALRRCSPQQVRVVLLGQDPYPTPQHATGLAFSVPRETCPLPPTLRNISEEMRCDLGCNLKHGDLTSWTTQGVLLLNRSLTIPSSIGRGENPKIGWDHLINDVFCRLRQQRHAENIFWVFWGEKSWELIPSGLDECQRLKRYHPNYNSPLNSDSPRAFFGSKPFSKINSFLEERGSQPIEWQVPAPDNGVRPSYLT